MVAVVVTRNPGTWFEDALSALGSQDYPNLSVLVIDAASDDDPVPRVARALPSAFVRHLDGNPGFGPAANASLDIVSGAAYLLFMHDDVRLESTSVRLLVEEALRSNAGIVGPKLVAWGAPAELLQVGMSVDKTGVAWSPVERRELDQEQHDRVRDVFWVPGACLLVRSDLFEALGGFDDAIPLMGEDVDLCWRAQVVGARVMVAPSARVEHLEALGTRRATDDLRRLHARHRIRTMLTCYGVGHLARVLPQAAVVAFGEMVYAVLVGQFSRARDVAGSWTWNLRRLGELVGRHRRLRALRTVPDADVRRLQVRGSARLNAFLRGEIGSEERVRALAAAGRDLAGSLRRGPRQRAVAVWTVLVTALVFGSRDLLTGPLPLMGAFVPFPDDPGDLLGAYFSAFRDIGLGAEAPAPTAFGLLGAAGVLFLGAMGQLQKVLVLGALPLGLLGTWRLAGHVRSSWARLAAVVTYAAVPLPYNALARGSWGGLVLYALAPWLLARILRSGRLAPFAPDPDAPPARRPLVREVLGMAALVTLVSAFVPMAVVIVPAVAVVAALGTALAGARTAALRSVAVAAAASGAAAVLHFPWVLDFVLPGGEWTATGGVVAVAPHDLTAAELLRFQTGPLGAGALGWAFLLPAALPLLVGQGWRFGAAVQAWSVAVAAWLFAWMGGRDWLPLELPAPEVILAFAATALALAVALGAAAFERDLRMAHFGWRQLASVVAAVALAVGALPVIGATVSGRWDAPQNDLATSLSFAAGPAEDQGGFRVLWLGDPAVLPLSAWPLADGVAFATSGSGAPDVRSLWASSASDPTRLLGDAVRLAAEGSTNRLGRLLAPMAVRYVVLVERAAPQREGTPVHPLPEGVERTMADQLDLRRVDADPAIALFENTAFAPVRAALDGDQAAAAESPNLFSAAVALELGGARPVLGEEDGHARWEGDVDGAAVYVAHPSSRRWQLSVDGQDAERTKAFGWANVFAVPPGVERGALRYDTPPVHRGVIALQVVLWVLATRALVLSGRRRRIHPGELPGGVA